MLADNMHLSDEQLLQLGDGECSAHEAARSNRHLAACWDCRSRKLELERTISEFVQLHHNTLDQHVPPATGPRALLKARLHDAICASRASWLVRAGTTFAKYRDAYAYAAMIVILAGMVSLVRGVKFLASPPSARASVQLRPNSNLTPGAIRRVDQAEICTAEQGERDPALPEDVRRSVFKEYGMQNVPYQDYAVDYLISPELGGTSDLRNLWPEPNSATIWNASAKDALEDRLHELVCERKIDLTTAQHDLANDWISAYKKYFHTQKPFPGSVLRPPPSQSSEAAPKGIFTAGVNEEAALCADVLHNRGSQQAMLAEVDFMQFEIVGGSPKPESL